MGVRVGLGMKVSPMRMKVNAFETWCYRMILGISWRDKVSNKKETSTN